MITLPALRRKPSSASSRKVAAIEPAGGAEVDLLDRGLDLELGGLQAPGQAALLARRPLAFDQQGEAFGKGELPGRRRAWPPRRRPRPSAPGAGRRGARSSVCRSFFSSFSVVVAGAAHVGVARAPAGRWRSALDLAVEAALEDRAHRAVRGARPSRAHARRPPRGARVRTCPRGAGRRGSCGSRARGAAGRP